MATPTEGVTLPPDTEGVFAALAVGRHGGRPGDPEGGLADGITQCPERTPTSRRNLVVPMFSFLPFFE